MVGKIPSVVASGWLGDGFGLTGWWLLAAWWIWLGSGFELDPSFDTKVPDNVADNYFPPKILRNY